MQAEEYLAAMQH